MSASRRVDSPPCGSPLRRRRLPLQDSADRLSWWRPPPRRRNCIHSTRDVRVRVSCADVRRRRCVVCRCDDADVNTVIASSTTLQHFFRLFSFLCFSLFLCVVDVWISDCISIILNPEAIFASPKSRHLQCPNRRIYGLAKICSVIVFRLLQMIK